MSLLPEFVHRAINTPKLFKEDCFKYEEASPSAGYIIYHRCVMTHDLLDVKGGELFDRIVVSLAPGFIEFYRGSSDNEPEVRYRMTCWVSR